MHVGEVKQVLNDTYLFAGVSDATLSTIAKLGRVETLAKDAVL
ncbi:MAG: hypothetical protein VW268_14790 [Rhodospirillaceae bacterium]